MSTTTDNDLLAPWKNAACRIVWDQPSHGMHAYFNTCPESPDGRSILLMVSDQKEGHEGRLVVINRATGKHRVIADGIHCEDAHRQACQQWTCNSKTVVYHNLIDGAWSVHAVDVETGQTRVLAKDRQVGFTNGTLGVVPLHGMHWAPGGAVDLKLVDVTTGEAKSVLTPDRVRAAWPEWSSQVFGDGPTSIFFPVMSPDGKRVFFKLAQPKDASFQSKTASKRDGLIAFDIPQDKLLFRRDAWGHPAWHPDCKTITTPMNVVINSDTGQEYVIPGLPEWPGSHPGYHPAGRLMTTDSYLRGENVPKGWWSVVVIDPQTTQTTRVHELHQLPDGATSWRPPHPHPVFSHDGNRLYFNVSKDGWTRLHVVEVKS